MPPKKKEDKGEQLKGSEAEGKILQYMKDQNRPHGVADIVANLKVIKKPDVVKSLQALEEGGELVSKTFAKQQIYCIKQPEGGGMSKEEIAQLHAQNADLKEQTRHLRETVKASEVALRSLENQPRQADIPAAVKRLDDELSILKKRLQAIQASQQTEKQEAFTEQELAQDEREYKKWRDLWSRRRKIVSEVTAMLKDGIENPEAHESLLEDLGVEGDSVELLALKQLEKEEAARGQKGKSVVGVKRKR